MRRCAPTMLRQTRDTRFNAPRGRVCSSSANCSKAAHRRRRRSPPAPSRPTALSLRKASAAIPVDDRFRRDAGASLCLARRRQARACAGAIRHLRCRTASASTSAPRPAAFRKSCSTAGARRIYAVDVGTAQLHASLRDNPRIVSLENTDIRNLSPAQLSDTARTSP